MTGTSEAETSASGKAECLLARSFVTLLMTLAGFSEPFFSFSQAWVEKGWNSLPHNHLKEIIESTMETLEEKTVIALYFNHCCAALVILVS